MDELDQRVDELLAHYRSLSKEPEPFELEADFLERVREIESFSCNQSGQDKSWVLRVEEGRRRYFASLKRKPGY
jgi:hypothetical protein